jgi:hypothetical protein
MQTLLCIAVQELRWEQYLTCIITQASLLDKYVRGNLVNKTNLVHNKFCNKLVLFTRLYRDAGQQNIKFSVRRKVKVKVKSVCGSFSTYA